MIETVRIDGRQYVSAATLAARIGMDPRRLAAKLRRAPERWRLAWPASGPAMPASRVGALLETLRPRDEAARARIAATLQEWSDQIDCRLAAIDQSGKRLNVEDYLRMLQLAAQGFDYEEIGSQVGCAEGTVRVFLSGKRTSAAGRAARGFFLSGHAEGTPGIRLPRQRGVKRVVHSAQTTDD